MEDGAGGLRAGGARVGKERLKLSGRRFAAGVESWRRVCSFPPGLTDAERKTLVPLVPLAKTGGRRRKHDERTWLDALSDFVPGGHAWRLRPRHFPPWKTVFHYLRIRRLDGADGSPRLTVALRRDPKHESNSRLRLTTPRWRASGRHSKVS